MLGHTSREQLGNYEIVHSTGYGAVDKLAVAPFFPATSCGPVLQDGTVLTPAYL